MTILTFNANKTTSDPVAQSGQAAQGERKWPHIPENTTLDVEVVRCEIRAVNREVTPWKTSDQEVSFAFKVRDGEYKNRWLWANTEAVLDGSDRCRLRQWIQEIIGVDTLPDGWEFDPNDLVGLDCRIRVGTYFSKKKQEIQNSVEDIMRSAVPPTGSAQEVF
jgi:hypothetical protein